MRRKRELEFDIQQNYSLDEIVEKSLNHLELKEERRIMGSDLLYAFGRNAGRDTSRNLELFQARARHDFEIKEIEVTGEDRHGKIIKDIPFYSIIYGNDEALVEAANGGPGFWDGPTGPVISFPFSAGSFLPSAEERCIQYQDGLNLFLKLGPFVQKLLTAVSYIHLYIASRNPFFDLPSARDQALHLVEANLGVADLTYALDPRLIC